MTVQRYEDYAGEEVANADEIVFKIYGDLATAFRDWQAGNIDITDPDPSQYMQAEALAGDRLVRVDSGAFAYTGFPLYMEEFQDVRIRQALSLAIDRETIDEKVYAGTRTPATDVIAPFVPGSRTDACEYCRYDPEEAKRLYDEAGGIPGDKITVWFNNDGGHEQFMPSCGQRTGATTSGSTTSSRRSPSPLPGDAGEGRGHRPVPPGLGPGLSVAGELSRPGLRRGQRQLRAVVGAGAREVPRSDRAGRRPSKCRRGHSVLPTSRGCGVGGNGGDPDVLLRDDHRVLRKCRQRHLQPDW
ncbi:MAG: ABC transporter substrate-binding protein [Nocardioidaceae bacterium]